MIPFLQAMARQEGAIDSHGNRIVTNRAGKNNNPGDIEYGAFTHAHGASGTDGRFAIFPDMKSGFQCMAALLQQPLYKGMSIRVTIYEWLGYKRRDAELRAGIPNEPGNYPEQYIHNVSTWTGLPDSEIIDSHLEIPS